MTFCIALCSLAFGQLEARAAAEPKASGGDDAWIANIRRDHPRMFFNADTWPSVKARTLSEPAVRAQYEKLLRDCDGYPAKPVCRDFGPVDTSKDIRIAFGPVIPAGKSRDMHEAAFDWMAGRLEAWGLPVER